MTKPIIGIVGKVTLHKEEDFWHRVEVVDEVRLLVTKYGGISIMLLPTEDTLLFNQTDTGDDTILTKEQLDDLYRQMDLCDGFILQGGDVSCAFEVEIAKKAIELDKPIIGICAGFNNILRALGSNIYQDDNAGHNHHDINYRHHISVVKGTKLYEIIGSEDYEVNSFHTMLAKKEMVEPYAKISSYSDDGLVESFELEDKKFVVAVKWHPEQMRDEKYVANLFNEFIRNC